MLIYLGYIGLFFAFIYRIPQIVKIYNTQKGGDISKKTFILHNFAYFFLLSYIVCKENIDILLVIYYITGILMNLIIISMKLYYNNLENENISNN